MVFDGEIYLYRIVFIFCFALRKSSGVYEESPKMWSILANKTLDVSPSNAGCDARTPATFCIPDVHGAGLPTANSCLQRTCSAQNAALSTMTDHNPTTAFVTRDLDSLELSAQISGTFNIFYFYLAFSGNPPSAVIIQRRVNGSSSDWTLWRYFAVDCMATFGAGRYQSPLDGSVTYDAVQCSAVNWTSSKLNVINFLLWDIVADMPYTRTENDDARLDQLTRASAVKISLIGHVLLLPNPGTTYGAQGYSISEIEAYGRCANGFYRSVVNGTTSCLACDCSTAGALQSACNSQGICSCKVNFVGKQCDQCHLGNFNVATGCPLCDCDAQGTTGEICDGQTGQCLCRSGFAGPRCAGCLSGYYLLGDACIPCDCSLIGTTRDVCDRKGACLCKRLVTGARCTLCLDGFVDLSLSNPEGCSRPPIPSVLLLDPGQNHTLNSRDLNFSITDNLTYFYNGSLGVLDTSSPYSGKPTDSSVTLVEGSVVYPWLIAITVLLILALLIALIHFILYIRRRSWHKTYSPRQVPEFLTADNVSSKRPENARARTRPEQTSAKLTGYFYNPEYPLGALTPGLQGRRETATDRNGGEYDLDPANADVANSVNEHPSGRRQLDLRQEPASVSKTNELRTHQDNSSLPDKQSNLWILTHMLASNDIGTGVLSVRPHGHHNQRTSNNHPLSTISGGITNENFDIRPEAI